MKLLPEGHVQRTIAGIGGKISLEKQLPTTRITLGNVFNDYRVRVLVTVIPHITESLGPVQGHLESLEQEWGRVPHRFKMIREVDGLLGMDVIPFLCKEGVKVGASNRILIWKMKLGTALGHAGAQCENQTDVICNVAKSDGKVEKQSSDTSVGGDASVGGMSGASVGRFDEPESSESELTKSNRELARALQQFWSIENLGVTDDAQAALSTEEKWAVEFFEKNTIYNGERYQVRLPFHPKKKKPQNNYRSALRRYYQQEKRLQRDKTLAEYYVSSMEEYMERGFAEEVTLHDPERAEGFFLPHLSVLRLQHSTTKVRLVFDASAEDHTGYSLNDSLMQGPNVFQQELADVLLRIRNGRYCLQGDIKKMYLMIIIHRDDRSWLRFLWKKPGESGPPRVYQKTVLPFGLNCAPYIACAVVAKHIRKNSGRFPLAAGLLGSGLYMDDVLIADHEEELLIRVRREIDQFMPQGGFEFGKWMSNSPAVLASIPEEQRAQAAAIVLAEKDVASLSPDGVPKTLGLLWESTSDSFEIAGTTELGFLLERETKRTLCSRSAQLFDPLGFLAPYVLRAKVFMQHCWRIEMEWDEPLPSDLLEKWKGWIREIYFLHFLQLPRNLTQKGVEVIIHGFSDASCYAAGACVYVLSETRETKTCRLVMAKTKVAPLKAPTIPRMELIGALLLSQAVKRVRDHYEVREIILWTDSTTVLCWLKKPPSHWKTFVGNRVQKIMELNPTAEWRYVNTLDNPADIASRGASALDLIDFTENGVGKKWFNGPHFLSLPRGQWPQHPPAGQNPWSDQEVADEVQETKIPVLVVGEESEDQIGSILKRYSNFAANMRLLAYVFRFVHNVRTPKPSRETAQPPSYEELQRAEGRWIRNIQQRQMGDIIQLVQRREKLPVHVQELNPYIDEEGILRIKGRLEMGELSEARKSPPILPKDEPTVGLMIMTVHRENSHVGPETLLHLIREKYWLLGGRRYVKKTIRQCYCYKMKAKSFQQHMAPLPKERLEPNHAFESVGLDFAGPMNVFYEDKEEYRNCYVLVITCLTSRAVHFEAVLNMTTGAFINALTRFIARRGCCKKILCDNQLTFVKAEKEIRKLIKSIDFKKIEQQFASFTHRIEFQFIPAHAPHRGGVYERQVGNMKKALVASLGKERATYDEFMTVLCQAEAAVNSRPLTTVSDDVGDELPITPAHLIIGKKLLSLPDDYGKDDREDKVAIMWRQRQRLSGEFWTRWTKEYLNTLQKYSKWHMEGHEPRVGEIVLVEQLGKKNKLFWPLGKIEQLFSGRDGRVRSAGVRMLKGNVIYDPPQKRARTELVRRDTRHLYRLEEHLEAHEEAGEDSPSTVSKKPGEGESAKNLEQVETKRKKDMPPRRHQPKRSAAERGRPLL